MAYFKLFPKVGYDFNRDGIIQNVVDIFRHARPLQNFADQINTYRQYTIPDGQRPDICSQKLYGTPDYYWTFFILNDFLHDGMASWPMSQQDLFNYIETEYNGVAIETRPNVVRNTDGGIVDFRNSLAGRFQVGETITGGTSFATGTLAKKDIYLNQLIVQDVTGSFIGDGVGNNLEAIIGGTSTDSYKALKKLYGKPLGQGMKQLTMFEDLLDVKEFLSEYRILSRQKRDEARTRRNQAKYKNNPNP